MTKICLLFVHRHRLRPAAFCQPPPLPEDQLLPLSIYTHTFQFLSPLFSSLFLFVYLSQIKGASFLNLLLHPCPEAPSTKGSMMGGHLREEQLELNGEKKPYFTASRPHLPLPQDCVNEKQQ